MGTRKKRQRQEELWYGGELPTAPGHPFYKRLNEVLDNAGFDPFCETSCAGFYHRKLGRPSLPPGQYFRVMMIGFFELLSLRLYFQYRHDSQRFNLDRKGWSVRGPRAHRPSVGGHDSGGIKLDGA